nr:PCRF domain-containing protein [Nostoc sp. PCC 7107]
MQKLDQLIIQPHFWEHPEPAYQTLQEIEYIIYYRQKQYQQWCSKLEDIKVALELIEISADEQLLQEAQTNLAQLQKELETAEIRQLLSDPYDKKGALLSIAAESHDAEAQKWAYTLFQIYYNWAKNQNYHINLIEDSCGDGGIIFASWEITGRYAYGCLKSELGIHQLQRILPFDTSGNLQISLARVEVFPILDDSAEFEIPQKHLEITLPRNQGNRNRAETWVQVVHLPTGITVFCDQQGRPMDYNKKKALAILKGKLWAIALAQGVNSIAEIQPKRIKDLSNNIIREYILHPYTQVKDLRTNAETTDVTDVLNGDINLFIKAHLQQNVRTSPSQ